MQMVGADLHIRPKVTLRTNRTAMRHKIMVSINQMYRMDCLYRHNALGRIYKSAPTVHGILFQQPHVSPPLRLKHALLASLHILKCPTLNLAVVTA